MSDQFSGLPETGLWIDGRRRDAADGGTFAVVNPATERELAAVSGANAADVDMAVAAARRAFDEGPWPRMHAAERGEVLRRIAALLDRDVERFATLEALDVGKPRGDALAWDIPSSADTFRWFAGLADAVHGAAIPVAPAFGQRRHVYTVREPLGVLGAITPWNTPTAIAAWKLAPALAVGCCAVLKPAEDAPLTALALAELTAEAGLPPGVLNIVPGVGAVAGRALVAHPGVDKVSFTGSPAVGREIGSVAGGAFKKLTLELGGKSPQLVFGDVDVAAVAPGVAGAIFANQGEVCAAGTRVLVHRSRHAELVEALAEAARAVRVGDPLAADTTMGALISERHVERVLGYVRTGRDEGAQLVTGGARLPGAGWFVEPTLFTGDNAMRIAQEEIFGPVGMVVPFDDEREAVRLANDTRYGLAAVVWTDDVARAHRVAGDVRAGTVWVNGAAPPDPRLPWGGPRLSGVGKELGLSGLLADTEEKVVSVAIGGVA